MGRCLETHLISRREASTGMPTLRINSGFCRQIFEKDLHGQTIYPDAARTINVCTTNDIETTAGRMSFLVVVRVSKSLLSREMDADALALSWLAENLPSHIAKATYWNFFGYTWLDYTGPVLSAQPERGVQAPVDVDLTDSVSRQLVSAMTRVASIQRPFEDAKERLREFAFNNTAFGFKHSLGEARRLLTMIGRVLDASADVGGSNASHVRNALRSFEELASRKVESNRNYQLALSDFQRFTYCLSFPNSWGAIPAP